MAGSSPAEYISHHIQNLTYGRTLDGSWGFAHSAQEATQMGFVSINVDTMFWSLLTGIIFCVLFRKALGISKCCYPSLQRPKEHKRGYCSRSPLRVYEAS